MSNTVPASVIADADAAYERQDREWFTALSTETLAAMWAQCCDIETMPAWDDEVYDALAARDYFVADLTPPRDIAPGTLAGDVTQQQLDTAPEQIRQAFAAAEREVEAGKLSPASSVFDMPIEEFVAEFAPKKAAAGAIDPPISEWSMEDYDAFKASGQLD